MVAGIRRSVADRPSGLESGNNDGSFDPARSYFKIALVFAEPEDYGPCELNSARDPGERIHHPQINAAR
jgi:hypothetical protein